MVTTTAPAHLLPSCTHERDEIGRELQATLLALVQLSPVGKQLHWSVTGLTFRSLHLQLDELAASVTVGIERGAGVVEPQKRSPRSVPPAVPGRPNAQAASNAARTSTSRALVDR